MHKHPCCVFEAIGSRAQCIVGSNTELYRTYQYGYEFQLQRSNSTETLKTYNATPALNYFKVKEKPALSTRSYETTETRTPVNMSERGLFVCDVM